MLFINCFITSCFNFIPDKSVNNLHTIYGIFKYFVELFLGHVFIQSLNKYILSTYVVPRVISDNAEIAVKKQTAIPVLREKDTKQIKTKFYVKW